MFLTNRFVAIRSESSEVAKPRSLFWIGSNRDHWRARDGGVKVRCKSRQILMVSNLADCKIQKSSHISLRLRMDSISSDFNVMPTSFPQSRRCVRSVYETDSAEVRYPIVYGHWECAIRNCLNHVWDDFGSGWVTFSMDGWFGFVIQLYFTDCLHPSPYSATITICIRSAMSAIGFDCIWLGCCGLDSVVFHSGLKAMTSSVLPRGKLWPDSVQFANATPQPLFRISVQLRIDRMHVQKMYSFHCHLRGRQSHNPKVSPYRLRLQT